VSELNKRVLPGQTTSFARWSFECFRICPLSPPSPLTHCSSDTSSRDNTLLSLRQGPNWAGRGAAEGYIRSKKKREKTKTFFFFPTPTIIDTLTAASPAVLVAPRSKALAASRAASRAALASEAAELVRTGLEPAVLCREEDEADDDAPAVAPSKGAATPPAGGTAAASCLASCLAASVKTSPLLLVQQRASAMQSEATRRVRDEGRGDRRLPRRRRHAPSSKIIGLLLLSRNLCFSEREGRERERSLPLFSTWCPGLRPASGFKNEQGAPLVSKKRERERERGNSFV
jgi:hypothetical protein